MNQTFANVNDKIFKLVYQEFNFCHQTSAFFNANFKKQINCKHISGGRSNDGKFSLISNLKIELFNLNCV